MRNGRTPGGAEKTRAEVCEGRSRAAEPRRFGARWIGSFTSSTFATKSFAAAAREHGKGPGPTEAADRRARAFSLLVHAYDQTRRAVTYLRWDEEDADTVAPSLYKGCTGRATAHSDAVAAPGDEAPAEPAAPGAATPAALNGTAAPAALNGTAAPAVPGAAPNGTAPTS